MISKDKAYFEDHKKALSAYKTVYGLVSPITLFLAIVFGFFSLFNSADGSNSRTVSIVLFVVFAAITVALFVIEKTFEKNEAYITYTPRVLTKVNLGRVIALLVFSLIIIIPFYLLVLTSLKHSSEANEVGFSWWPKTGFTSENFEAILHLSDSIGIDMILAFFNSMVYSLIPTIVGLFVSALAAFSFAKLYFPGRDFVYSFLIFTMVIPACVATSSSYVLYDWFGWTGNFLFETTDFGGFSLVLLVPGMFGSVGTIMFLREYYKGIPDDLLNSAQIDGASKFRIFTSIMIPLGMPALIAQFVLAFISKYNDFMGPLIYLKYPEQYTIQLALQFVDDSGNDRATLAAAGVFGLVPMLLLYTIFQKPIMNGISLSSGLKG